MTRASIVGVSLGGWLALDYATRRPARAEKLVLLCPGGVERQKALVLLDSRQTQSRLTKNVPRADTRMFAEAGHLIRGQTSAILDFLIR